MRFIDLSAPITSNPTANPAFLRTEIAFSDHQAGAGQIQALFRVPPPLLRDQEGWAIETFTNFGTHNSTHVDAPWHYNSRIQGERAATIDELPLEWFFSDGVVLDMTAKADGDGVTVADIERELARIGYQLKPLDIVMVRTGCDRFYQDANYIFRGPGVTADATRWLYAQGIRVMGIDAWGWDVPLDRQAQETLAKQQPGIFWAAHQVDLPYSQIERLMNLDQLPPYGFKVSCFPLRIVGGSAGPARVVAIVQ
ncbi:MAG: cyclase family protein [Caldilineaceae bacterium]